MPLFLTQTAPLLAVWKVEETSEQLLSLLDKDGVYSCIPEEIHTEKRKQEWLAVRLLLKELLGRKAVIAYYPSGAPYLSDSPLHISISHTKGYAAVLLQEEPFAGIDIEYRSERVQKIRWRFLSEKEAENIDPAYEVDLTLIHWCAKEALFKMIGQAEVEFREQLHIEPFPYRESGIIQAYETRTVERRRYSLGYQVYPDFILVWSVTNQDD